MIETRFIKQPVGESQHLGPGVHPRVQQKIVCGYAQEDPGNARFDDTLDDPFWLQILRSKDVEDRQNKALHNESEIEDHQGDLHEIFNHHYPSDRIRPEKSMASILINLIIL